MSANVDERHCEWSASRSGAIERFDGVDREQELRAFCRRLFGSAADRAGVVDDVMHTLDFAMAHRIPIALRGNADLVPVAHALHRLLLGAERPFVVCDPRRCETDGTVRSPANRKTSALARDAATGGSVCIRAHRLPPQIDILNMSLRARGSIAMLFVCLQGHDTIRDLLSPPIEIPTLTKRGAEAERVLDESLDEAAQALCVRRAQLAREKRRCILDQAKTFADLEKTALRVVAIASSRNVSQAAQRLQMAPVSLTRWMNRRGWSAAWLTDAAQCDDTGHP